MNPDDIIVYPDGAEICTQPVHRPTYISRSEWLAFWESVKYGDTVQTGEPGAEKAAENH